MNFLIDAQLPRRLVYRLREAGHDAVHTLDLPDGNRTADEAISELAAREDRVVVTKDCDFVSSHLLSGLPPRLLVVSTGNISNPQLERLFLANLDALVRAMGEVRYVELSRSAIIIHG